MLFPNSSGISSFPEEIEERLESFLLPNLITPSSDYMIDENDSFKSLNIGGSIISELSYYFFKGFASTPFLRSFISIWNILGIESTEYSNFWHISQLSIIGSIILDSSYIYIFYNLYYYWIGYLTSSLFSTLASCIYYENSGFYILYEARTLHSSNNCWYC